MPLVNMVNMLQKAKEGKYAVGQFNINNLEWTKTILLTAQEQNSPVILGVSEGAAKYMGGFTTVVMMVKGLMHDLNITVDVAIHLDHGSSYEKCVAAIDAGFTSVMIDASHFPLQENIALTKKVVDYAHQFDVTVEGELGVLAGVEDEVQAEESHYTKPEEVVDFATRSGVDSLAISIGTSHGAYKFKPEQCTRDPKTGRLIPPPLAFDVLAEIEKQLPGFPIVLHGSSSVPQEYVDIINEYGGKLPDAVGIPEEQLRKAAKSAVCKINIDSDSRLAFTAGVRETFAKHPEYFDPRQYCGKAREYMEQLYAHKVTDVLGSDHKLANCD